MTRYIADYASYQGAITAADIHRAEFQVINFKIGHGLGAKSVHPRIVQEIASARRLGLGIASFHWLTGDHGGRQQAEYAYARMQALGIEHGTMHTVDVEEQTGSDDAEDAPTYGIVRDYVLRMEELLGRPIALYTGDWWWEPRKWNGAELTPYLMAAPNPGYTKDKRYPGDTSGQWAAGYGGWPNLSIMQYATDTLIFPGGGRSAKQVSKAAMRDESVWRALTGGGTVARAWTLIPCLVALRDEFNAVAPRRDKGADGSIGDSAHTSSSDHTPDEISNVLRDHDADDKNEVHALDVDSDGPWPDGSGRAAGGWFDRKVKALIAEERRRWLDPKDKCRLEYVIWRRTIYSRNRDFAPAAYSGAAHEDHAHFSGRYLTATENDTRAWGVKATPAPAKPAPATPAPKPQEDAVEAKDIKAIVDGIFARPIQDRADEKTPQRKLTFQQWMEYTDTRHDQVMNSVARVASTLAAIGSRLDTLEAKIEELRGAPTVPETPTTPPATETPGA